MFALRVNVTPERGCESALQRYISKRPTIEVNRRYIVQPYPPPSGMSHPYPGSELSVEQLVHALAQVLNPGSPLRRYVHV